MVFSKSSETPKNNVNKVTVNSSPKRVQQTPVNSETIYYMQNSMIGRLMNVKKCASCPKH